MKKLFMNGIVGEGRVRGRERWPKKWEAKNAKERCKCG
jgi:hypothetical protein